MGSGIELSKLNFDNSMPDPIPLNMHIVKTKLKKFSAAHRIIHGYQGKCNSLHGHDYAIEITFGAEKLDQHGFVLDFNDIKKYCNGWVQEHWDHGAIIQADDKALIEFVQRERQKHFILENYPNTSVECLVHYLFHQLNTITKTQIKTKLNPHAQLLNIEIWENEDSSASYGIYGASTSGVICGVE